jgi:hypothetical protein
MQRVSRLDAKLNPAQVIVEATSNLMEGGRATPNSLLSVVHDHSPSIPYISGLVPA